MKVIDKGGQRSPYLPPGVGGTPLVEVEGILAKLECVNPCGSVKDRLAAYVLRAARESGSLQPGQPIVEATSGNTGIAFAFYGRSAGHPVTIVMPEHMTEERKALIRKLGAKLVLCSKEGSFAEAAAIRDRISEETGAFNPNQFANPLNAECHQRTTGVEIVHALIDSQICLSPGNRIAFVAGVGTGGTLVGIGSALQEHFPSVGVFAVEPAEAAVMTGEESGPHGIYGIGDGFIPELASDGQGRLHPIIDGVEVVSTAEAMEGARELGERHGLCVGVSSGANFVAAKRLSPHYDSVITVFADGHQKYHSAGLSQPAEAACPFHEACALSELEGLLQQIG